MNNQKGRIRADAKGRVSLTKFLRNTEPVDLDVSVTEDGRIILTPLATIPAHELWIYENPQILKSLNQAIDDVSKGNVRSRGSFSQYVE